MSLDYSALAADARSLLAEFGQTVTRRAYSAGTYDPATGAATPTTADTSRSGVMLDFAAGQTQERGTLIQGGDKRVLLDAAALVLPTDHFLVGGVEYVVISIGEVNPAGTPVLYDIHLRS